MIANNIESIAVVILAGNHVGYLPEHFAECYEKQGLLKRIQPRKYSQLVDISIIYKAGRRQSAAMRLFRDICSEQISISTNTEAGVRNSQRK